MSDDVDKPAPENVETVQVEGAQASGDAEQKVEDVEHTAVKIDELSKKYSRERRPTLEADDSDEERVVVDRTALEAILDVSSRLKDIQKKSRVSMSTLALGHESYKDKQVNKFDN